MLLPHQVAILFVLKFHFHFSKGNFLKNTLLECNTYMLSEQLEADDNEPRVLLIIRLLESFFVSVLSLLHGVVDHFDDGEEGRSRNGLEIGRDGMSSKGLSIPLFQLAILRPLPEEVFNTARATFLRDCRWSVSWTRHANRLAIKINQIPRTLPQNCLT